MERVRVHTRRLLELWFLTLSYISIWLRSDKEIQRQAIGVKKVSTDSVFGALVAFVTITKMKQQQQRTKNCSTLMYIQMK